MTFRLKYIFLLPAILTVASCELPEDIIGTPAERLEGSWTVNETSSLYKSTADIYQVYFEINPDDSSQVLIENFYQLGRDTYTVANVEGNNLSIPRQIVDGFEITGSGRITQSFEAIETNYTVDDGSGQIDHVQADFSKLY